MYKIFLDKTKNFECDITIEGAKLEDSEVRLLLEADNFSVTLKGKISKDGTVKIPIRKLKGVLEENHKGKISLEVIAEDTRFVPWESEYETSISKKVEVKVNESQTINESKEEIEEEIKPKITFKLKEEAIDVTTNISDIKEILKENKVSYKLLYHNPPVFNELIETYCKENSISDDKHINEIKKQMFNVIKQ